MKRPLIVPSEKRIFTRKRLNQVSAKLKDGLSTVSNAVEMFDISIGGVSFFTPSLYPKGKILSIRIPLEEQQIGSTIQVVNCTHYPFLANFHRVSVEFINLDPQQAERIREYVGRSQE